MRSALAAAFAVGLLTLTACGTQRGTSAEDASRSSASSDTPSDAPGAMPTQVPAAGGEVVGVGTVMDTGKPTGPELCLGAVAESYPPQCSGIPMEGWNWQMGGPTAEFSGTTRWGSYAVTGTFDGSTFTVTDEPVSSALYDPAAPVDDPLRTRCREPAAGWAVVDRDRVSYQDQDAVMAAAMQLPGYAGSFVDTSGRLRLDQPAEPQGTTDDRALGIVNVLVTEDVEGAERILRDIWGGALCVSLAENAEQDLVSVQDELVDLPGLLSSGAELGRLRVDVIWDDGSLQEWVDATYGDGLVAIEPALQPLG